MKSEGIHFFEFKAFRLNVAERQLLHHNSPVSLTPKAFDVLALLVEHSGHLVGKDELLETVWADSFVEEQNVTRTIHTLRRALGEDENGGKFIETVAKKGYRFVAEVTEVFETDEPKLKNGNGSGVAAAVAAGAFPAPDPLGVAAAFGPVPTVSTERAPAYAQARQRTRIILFTVGFLTAVFLLVLLSFNYRSDPEVGPNKVTSIAVLPIKPVNATQRDEAYETGIAETLIHTLGSMKGIIVRQLSATRKYADLEQDAITAGREQKVNFVLASNYQLADGKIRITSQLFNVATEEIEETYTSERDAANLFAMQDAIAGDLGKRLQARFGTTSGGSTAKRGTGNEEAYRLYIQGAALVDKRNPDDVAKGVERLEQAIQLDPNYAPAYAKLANGLSARGATREKYPRAKAAVERALSIDDTLAEAHSYLGEIKSDFERDFLGAEREHKRAIELNPNSSVTHRMYALLLIYLGRHDESIAESKTAVDLEPATIVNHLVFGRGLLFARRYDEAITELDRAAEMGPDYRFVQQSLSVAYRYKGDRDRAFDSWMKAWVLPGRKTDEINSWKETYARLGWRGFLERSFEEAKADERDGEPDYNLLANNASELCLREEAFAYLEKALVQQGALTMLKIHPRFDCLRDDARFDDLLKRAGF